MKRGLLSVSIALIVTLLAFGQKGIKPAAEWTAKDAEKILNNSGWGQTQTETDTSEMFYQPTESPTSRSQSTTENRGERGATNQATSVKYFIRFLSAKPIREAIVRDIELKQKDQYDKNQASFRNFIDRTFADNVIIVVTFDSRDGRFLAAARSVFNSANTGKLKNNSYLERKDGKRIFLTDYQPPSSDGLGAKFVFARNVDGQPFLAPETGMVRFNSELSDKIKLNMRFKVSDMLYNGQLEY